MTACATCKQQFRARKKENNRQRAHPLRTRPHKRVTLIMVGLFTTDATIKSKHFRREELVLLEEKHMFFGNGC